MSKSPNTIAEDVYAILDRDKIHTPSAKVLEDYKDRASSSLARSFESRGTGRDKSKFWFTDLGTKCARQLWYKFNQPADAEALRGNVLVKFMYGDAVEDIVLALVEEAGHIVEDRQRRVEYTQDDVVVSGRIDCIIDGWLVDVKSASSFAYSKYINGITPDNDSFGYLYQISGYYNALVQDGVDLKGCGFLFIDKSLGHIKFVPVKPYPDAGISSTVRWMNTTVNYSNPDSIVRLETKPEGKSGNEILGTECSYCAFKNTCWPDLRTFLYSSGPKFFTKVVVEPKVPEVNA